jgi:hypothetical protein
MQKKLLRMEGELLVVCHKLSKIWAEKKSLEYVSLKIAAQLKKVEQN